MAQNSLVSSTPIQKEIILDLKVNDKQVVNTIIEAQKALEGLKKTKAEYDERLKKGQQLSQQEWEDYIKTKTEINDLNNTIRANQKALDEQVKSQKNNSDSINAMRAQLKLLRAEYEDMSGTVRNSDFGKSKLKEIDDLTEAIREAEFAQKDFRRNVGNYPEVGNAKQALRELRVECQNLAVELHSLQGAREAQAAVVNSLADSVGKESAEYKQAVEELNRLNAAYTDTTSKLNDMEKKAGELNDVLSDSSKRISSFANDQQRLAAAQEGVGVLTSAYTALKGAMALAGIESKSMLEVYAKIQVVQQSVNAAMTIAKALNKDSNLMIALRNKLEQTRLTWTKAYTAALQKQNKEIVQNTAAETANAASVTATTVAEGAATTATFSLRAAFEALKATMLSNPITTIILGVTTALGVLIPLIKKFVGRNKEATESTKKLKEEQEKLRTSLKDRVKDQLASMSNVTSAYEEEIAKVKTLMSVVKSEVASYTQKAAAVKELNRIVPEYNGHLDETGKLIEGNTEKLEAYIVMLEQKARAEGYAALLVEEYKKEADLQRQILEHREKMGQAQEKYFKDVYENTINGESMAAKQLADEEQTIIDGLNDQLAEQQAQIQSLLDVAGSFVDVTSLIKKNTGSTKSTTDNSSVKKVQDQYNEMLKLAQDYYKSLEQLQSEAIKTATDKENARYQGERDQLNKALVDAEQLYSVLSKDPKLLKELQKDNPYLSLESLTSQIQILNTELDNAEKRHLKNIEDINEETNKAFTNILNKLQSDLDKVSENATVRYTAQLKERLNALDDELKRELELHEYTEEQKAILTAKYEEKKASIIKEFSNSSNAGGNYNNIKNINTLKDQLAVDIAELEARKAAELAVFEGTEAEKARIVEEYAKKRVEIENQASKQETQIWANSVMMIAQSLNSAMQGMTELFNVMAEDNAEMQRYSKELAMGQIVLSAAIATAQAVVAAINAGKDTGIGAAIAIPLFLLEFTGIVAGVIAQAKSTLSQAGGTHKPKFATGGLVGNKTTTKRDDKISAQLSEGEYVIQSKIVKKYGVEFFDHLNETPYKKLSGVPAKFATGGTVPSMTTIQMAQSQIDYSQMKDMFTEVVQEIQPVVSVREINSVQNRVNVKEQTASYN